MGLWDIATKPRPRSNTPHGWLHIRPQLLDLILPLINTRFWVLWWAVFKMSWTGNKNSNWHSLPIGILVGMVWYSGTLSLCCERQSVITQLSRISQATKFDFLSKSHQHPSFQTVETSAFSEYHQEYEKVLEFIIKGILMDKDHMDSGPSISILKEEATFPIPSFTRTKSWFKLENIHPESVYKGIQN